MFYLCKTKARIFRRQQFGIFNTVVSASHRTSASVKWLSGPLPIAKRTQYFVLKVSVSVALVTVYPYQNYLPDMIS